MSRELGVAHARAASLDAFLRHMEEAAALVRIRGERDRMSDSGYQEPARHCFANALVPAAHLAARVRDTGCDGPFPVADPRAYVRNAVTRLAAILGLVHARVVVRDRPGLERLLSARATSGNFAEPAMVFMAQQWFLEACQTALATNAGPIPEIAACFSVDQDTREIRDYAFLNRIAALNLEHGFMILCCEEALPMLLRMPVPAVLSRMSASGNVPCSMIPCLSLEQHAPDMTSIRALIVKTLGSSAFWFILKPRKEL